MWRSYFQCRAPSLSLAYNTFFTDLYVPTPSEDELKLRFEITGKGTPPEEAFLTLQFCLKAGETLETASGQKIVLGTDRIELDSSALGGWIRHHGWMLEVDPTAQLVWPVSLQPLRERTRKKPRERRSAPRRNK